MSIGMIIHGIYNQAECIWSYYSISPMESIWSYKYIGYAHIIRVHFVYAPSQWKTTLHCNIVSHWRGVYIKWSLIMVQFPCTKTLQKNSRNQVACADSNSCLHIILGIVSKTYTSKSTVGILNFSLLNKIHIFHVQARYFWVEFQRVTFKYHTKYLAHLLKDMIFIHHRNLQSS